MRLFFFLLLLISQLFASLTSKSAIVYYGENISYSMVGIHDYIIVQPDLTNTTTHGFSLYKKQMYAYVSIGEIDKNIPAYKEVQKEWIVAQNKAWKSAVLDIKNVKYREFLFEKMIEPVMQRGFKNFFFDTLDSYELYSKTVKQRTDNRAALVAFIKEFHKRYPDAKLILNRGFNIIDEVHEDIQAVLFESYYHGVGGAKLAYREVSKKDREWLDIYIKKIKSYGLDVICLDYLNMKSIKKAEKLEKKIEKKGMIPYVSNRDLTGYGVSSKNAIKREIFTLVDESASDIRKQEAIVNMSVVFEYMGYMQRYHDISKGLPKMAEMQQYKGVVIWLRNYYKKPELLMQWVLKLKKLKIKVVFLNIFGFVPTNELLKSLEIQVVQQMKMKVGIASRDKMMGYEIEPPMSLSSASVHVKNAKSLLSYAMSDGTSSTPAAITSWGGYALEEAFMSTIGDDNIWVINPFAFFKEALELEELVVPDVTTENGKRLLFSHIDGDGMMNRVEGDFGYYSGDVILNKILKVYKIPHSVSIIGAEVEPNGLYPKESAALMKIASQMYALDNVEPATHTFTHPFFWGKIKNDNLDEKYRLKPKGYHFSIENEIEGSLAFINKDLHPKREAKMVFWSGDCMPRNNALSNVYKNGVLNINGGDTTITDLTPWLSTISPMGIQRGEYVQVFTGAQNENVFTNDWLGPFWGFKRVVQTFELTNEPRRFKPIDIYYHLYSGSKQASLEALKYVFNWAIKQDTMPIYTSEYIPKVMDYYAISIAHEGNQWLFSGMKDDKTLRIERKDAAYNAHKSQNIVGMKQEKNRTYITLGREERTLLTLSKSTEGSYLISANAKLVDNKEKDKDKYFSFKGHVALKLEFHLAQGCEIKSLPKAQKTMIEGNSLHLEYKEKSADVQISCSH